tara:strand:- start:2346 stop:2765 length:420 start_codon:yes stop_codon:yes gene_type:complete
MITDEIKKKLALFLRETVGGSSGKMSLGTGGGSTNPTALTLDVPLTAASAGQSVTSSSSDNKVIELKASFTGSSLQGYTIREMGLFSTMAKDDQFDELVTSGASFDTDSDVMFSRVNFNAIGNFSTSDTVEVIYTIEVE